MNNIRTKNLIVTIVVFVFSVMGVFAQRLDQGLTDGLPVIDCRQMHTASITSTSKGQTEDLLKTAVSNATVFYRFAVAKVNNTSTANNPWGSAISICASVGPGWRLPTQRELQLIYVLHDQLMTKNGFTKMTGSYWCATEYSVDRAWRVSFDSNYTSGYTGNLPKTDKNLSVRCIKEL